MTFWREKNLTAEARVRGEARSSAGDDGGKLSQVVDAKVRLEGPDGLRPDSVTHETAPDRGARRRDEVDPGVADEQRVSGTDSRFFENVAQTHRIGLLVLERISAVDDVEVAFEVEAAENHDALASRLVRQHGESLSRALELVEGRADAGVGHRVI